MGVSSSTLAKWVFWAMSMLCGYASLRRGLAFVAPLKSSAWAIP